MEDIQSISIQDNFIYIKEDYYKDLLKENFKLYYNIKNKNKLINILLEFKTKFKDFKYEHDQDGLSVYVGELNDSCYEKILLEYINNKENFITSIEIIK